MPSIHTVVVYYVLVYKYSAARFVWHRLLLIEGIGN